jgi:hypothetical protein
MDDRIFAKPLTRERLARLLAKWLAKQDCATSPQRFFSSKEATSIVKVVQRLFWSWRKPIGNICGGRGAGPSKF